MTSAIPQVLTAGQKLTLTFDYRAVTSDTDTLVLATAQSSDASVCRVDRVTSNDRQAVVEVSALDSGECLLDVYAETTSAQAFRRCNDIAVILPKAARTVILFLRAGEQILYLMDLGPLLYTDEKLLSGSMVDDATCIHTNALVYDTTHVVAQIGSSSVCEAGSYAATLLVTTSSGRSISTPFELILRPCNE